MDASIQVKEIAMFIEVAKGIPVWVYGLFFGLLLFG